MKKVIYRILSIITIITLSIIFYNYKLAIIITGSMSPTININDLVLLRKSNNIKEGDIVSYKDNDNKHEILHRVIKIDNDKVIIKGDANNKEDNPINKEDITGIYITKLKYTKYIINLLSSKLLLLIITLTTIAFLLLKYKNKCIIYILLLITIINVSKDFYISKYNSYLSSKDSINTAKWNVEVDTSLNNSNNINLIADNNVEYYYLNLINNSEISTNYSITISNIPNNVEIKLDDSNYLKPVNNSISFNNINTLKPNKEKLHKLYFKALIDSKVSSCTINIDVNFIGED